MAAFPDGPYDGGVVGWPSIERVWQGKIFNAQARTVINRLFNHEAVTGTVEEGIGRLDHSPCFVIRYPTLPFLRDEVRYVAPSQMLGKMMIGSVVIAKFWLVQDLNPPV